MKLFSCGLITAFMLFCCKTKTDDYVLLKPIYVDESSYIEKNQPFTKEEVIKIISVLLYYGVNLKVSDDSIFIPEKYFSDMNYLYNIQIKSKDSLWYDQHIMHPEIIRYLK
ncbi:hypothetical protein [Flavobacterium gelatinilyticum]|uniref:hypothetical protein n=1 Tax=Flavobacterium gelatinilyticum TaxID=3003260 RepID=UPI002481055A|nr:hypothetical protein [Flavobacterium gelatinilyticum]